MSREVKRAVRLGLTPVTLMAVVSAVVLVTSSSSSLALRGAATTAVVSIVLCVGLYTFVGTTGIVSFGHMGLMAIGGYTCAILATPVLNKASLFEMPHWAASAYVGTVPALLIGGLAAALVAAAFSIPLVRLRGLSASLATFAFLVIVNDIANNWTQLTGGVTGYTSAPISTTAKSALVWALAAILIAFLFKESRVGLRLRASRDEEVATLGAGANVKLERAIAFAVSGAIVGVGGGLTGLQSGFVAPSAFYLDTTFTIIVMIVVGGVNSLSGAVIGSLLLSAVGYVLTLAQSGNVLGLFTFQGRNGIHTAGLAAIALLVLLIRPAGIFGYEEIGDWVYAVGRRIRPPLGGSEPERGSGSGAQVDRATGGPDANNFDGTT